MNNGAFGPGMMSRLYHQQRQPMQGQPMQGGMQGQQGRPMNNSLGAFMGQMVGMKPQRQGGNMDAIIAQLMQRRGG